MSDYYEIAYNDYLYMAGSEDTCQYNNLCTGAQQVAEKLLKSVAEKVLDPSDAKVINSHNLRTLYRKIREYAPDFVLASEGDLAVLKDMYFDARYPGENYFIATKEDYANCKRTVEDIIRQVNRFRTNSGLSVKEFRLPDDSFRELLAKRIGEDLADILLDETPATLHGREHLETLIEEFKKRHWKATDSSSDSGKEEHL